MWMQRTYVSGGVIEKTRFWVARSGKQARGPRRAKTEERKQEQNKKSAVRREARILNCNFKSGVLVKLGMDEKRYTALREKCGGDEEAMAGEYRHQAELFLLRMKRHYAKAGKKIKYWGAIADRNGRTGEKVRLHAHLCLTVDASDYQIIEKLWGKGKGLGWEPMWSKPDRYAIAEYIMRQAVRVGSGASYISSRDMIKPKVTEEIVMTNREIRTPPGSVVCERTEYNPEAPQYVRYIRRGEVQRE